MKLIVNDKAEFEKLHKQLTSIYKYEDGFGDLLAVLDEALVTETTANRYLTPAEWEAEHGEKLKVNALVWVKRKSEDCWFEMMYGGHLGSTYGDYVDVVVANGPYPPEAANG